MSSFAEELYAARSKAGRLESDFYDEVCKRLGDGFADDTSFDSYDDSFELYAVVPDGRLSAADLEWVWGLGFARCWLNYSDGTERYYYKGGDVAGYHHTDRAARGSDGEARAKRAAYNAGLQRAEEIARAPSCGRVLCLHESCMGEREVADRIASERGRSP